MTPKPQELTPEAQSMRRTNAWIAAIDYASVPAPRLRQRLLCALVAHRWTRFRAGMQGPWRWCSRCKRRQTWDEAHA